MNVIQVFAFIMSPFLMMTHSKAQSTRKPAATSPISSSTLSNSSSYSVEDFLEGQRQAYEKSTARLILIRSDKGADLSSAIQKTQDPWSLDNASKISRANTPGEPHLYNNKTTLSYARSEGYSFATYFDQTESSDRGLAPTKSWQTYGFMGQYEFLKTRHIYNENISRVELASRLTKLNNESSYLSQLMSLNDTSLNLYIQHCKLRDLQRLEGLMTQTLKIADVQMASKSIDIQDYLKINDLYLSFLRSIQNMQVSIVGSEQNLAATSEENALLAKSLHQKPLNCQKIQDESQTLPAPSREDAETIAKQHPSLATLGLQREDAKKSLGIYNLSLLPNLTGSTGIDRYNPGVSPDPYFNTYIGVTLTYKFQDENSRLTKLDYAKKVADIDYSEKVTLAQVTSTIQQLYESMTNQANFAQIAKRSLENSEKNLKVTLTRQEVGLINSDAVYSAYSNYSSTIQSLKDLWLGYKTSALRLIEIRKSTERTKKIRN